ncbi:MAG: CvpA family protein [Phycisphaerales bacterium]
MILTLLVCAIIALIAYWWANQGVLSAILHFACVLVAGAVAFALWEPLTTKLFLKGTTFDDYSWGVTLVGVFSIVLFILRLAADKLAPNDIKVPEWASYVFGGAFGLASGVLTVGILLIGWGYIHSTTELLGYNGFRRSQSANGAPEQTQPNLPPTMVVGITESVYNWLSVGAFSPIGEKGTLASWQPRLADVGASAFRDSYDEGRGKIALMPGSIAISEFYETPTLGQGAYVARIDVEQTGFDRRTAFTLSASQARLIGDHPTAPGTSFPSEFGQRNSGPDSKFSPFAFSDVTYYASSPSGAQSASFYLVFPKPPLNGQTPKFLQIKGLRFALPTPVKEPTLSSLAALLDKHAPRAGGQVLAGGANSPRVQAIRKALEEDASNAAALGGQHITANSTIDPVTVSRNSVGAGLTISEENYLVSGAGEFPRSSGSLGSAELRIKGIIEPKDTRIVRLDVSRGLSPVDIYDVDKLRSLRKSVGENATVELVDRNMDTYQPFGYIWMRNNEGKVQIFLDLPSRGIWTLGELPKASDEDRLYLLYRLPVNARISAVVLRDPDRPEKTRLSATADWTVPVRQR